MNLRNWLTPNPEALELTATTFDGLIAGPRLALWDVVTYIKKATRRQPLDSEERTQLGDVADRYPAIG